MSDHEQRAGRPFLAGHRFQDVQVGGDAKVQPGDTYHFSRENPLSLLPFATNARFNSYDRQHEPLIAAPSSRHIIHAFLRTDIAFYAQCCFLPRWPVKEINNTLIQLPRVLRCFMGTPLH